MRLHPTVPTILLCILAQTALWGGSVHANSPPVAVITVVGADVEEVRVGDTIVLQASDSQDPDGDVLTYSWVMPDGRVRNGPEVTWTANRKEVIRFHLTARDVWGESNITTLRIDVLEGKDQVERSDIWDFLLFIVPIAFFMLLIIVVVAILRGRKARRLESVLEEVGVIHKPQYIPHSEPRVLDLEPVKRSFPPANVITTREMSHGRDRDDSKVPEYQLPPPPAKDGYGPSGHKHSPRSVNATLECPGCGKVFQQRLDPGTIGKGKKVIECPHCGTEGEV